MENRTSLRRLVRNDGLIGSTYGWQKIKTGSRRHHRPHDRSDCPFTLALFSFFYASWWKPEKQPLAASQ